MEKIQYFSPEANKERDEYLGHSFEVISNGKKIGAAEVNYYSKPIPLYQVSDLYIDVEAQGKGLASRVMEQVETWLKERKKPGVLVDAIMDGPAQGMYERRGWQRVFPNQDLYVYNWPADIDLSVLEGYALRYTDQLERGI